MSPWLRGFAENQPMTPIIETMRSLLTKGTPGPHIWAALAWAAGILVVSYTLAMASIVAGRLSPQPSKAAARMAGTSATWPTISTCTILLPCQFKS
jgi:hypothetical protein